MSVCSFFQIVCSPFCISINICDINPRLLSNYASVRLFFYVSVDICDTNYWLLDNYIDYLCFSYSYFLTLLFKFMKYEAVQ